MSTRVALLKDVLSNLPYRWYILDAIMPSNSSLYFVLLSSGMGLEKLLIL